jgi:hypothetical protein
VRTPFPLSCVVAGARGTEYVEIVRNRRMPGRSGAGV